MSDIPNCYLSLGYLSLLVVTDFLLIRILNLKKHLVQILSQLQEIRRNLILSNFTKVLADCLVFSLEMSTLSDGRQSTS